MCSTCICVSVSWWARPGPTQTRAADDSSFALSYYANYYDGQTYAADNWRWVKPWLQRTRFFFFLLKYIHFVLLFFCFSVCFLSHISCSTLKQRRYFGEWWSHNKGLCGTPTWCLMVCIILEGYDHHRLNGHFFLCLSILCPPAWKLVECPICWSPYTVTSTLLLVVLRHLQNLPWSFLIQRSEAKLCFHVQGYFLWAHSWAFFFRNFISY